MSALKIVKGGAWTPPRLVIYGDEKSGKTSTAAQAPNPLYIGTDDGRRRLEVDGLEIPETWGQFVQQLEQVAEDAPGLGYGSVVTDTLNGVIELCAQHVCATQFGGKWNDPKHGFLAWGGKQGWGAVSEEVRRILPLYDRLIDAGLWVILLAHSQTEKVSNPTDGDYDRFAPAMHKSVWARVGQWADVLLRVDYDVTYSEDGGKRRVVSDGTRVLRCAATAGEVAGCRVGYELPARLPFAWGEIEDHLGKPDSNLIGNLAEAWGLLTDDEQGKAETYLGVPVEHLDEAPPYKIKALLARIGERSNE